MLDPIPPSQRMRRAIWATAAFLIGFAILLAVTVFVYLIPAIEAARSADESGRKALSAYSSLLLAVVLFVIGVGLMLTFRVHRFFFPSRYVKPTKGYPQQSAWEISGERVYTPTAEELESE